MGILYSTVTLDPRLTNIGIEDLKLHRNLITENINPDYIFSSGLLRAIQTAQILFPNSVINVAPHLLEHGFRKANFPSQPSLQLKHLNQDKVKYKYLGKGNNLDKLFQNRKRQYDRSDFKKFLKWLQKRVDLNKNLNIAVVGHGNFIKQLLSNSGMSMKEIKNAMVVEIILCVTDKGLVFSQDPFRIKFSGITEPDRKDFI
jgi:broad specificity phosphatase PhoE